MERTKKAEVKSITKPDFGGEHIPDPVVIEGSKKRVKDPKSFKETNAVLSVREVDLEAGKTKWRKVGGGTFRMGKNRIIKPNQTFMAHPDEIPMPFRDVIVPVIPLPPEKVLRAVSQKYEVKSDKTPGWYNVFDGNGKQLNERRMKQDAAKSLVDSLEGEKEELKKLSVKPDKSAGWFNVFDETGKQLNTRRMRKAAAETLAGGS